VIVYCRKHGRAIGEVRLQPIGGFPEFRYRTPRFRDRQAAALGVEGRHNALINLREWSRPTISPNGCRECGEREIKVTTLLTGFDRGRSAISV
jgi:hypothetical protein